MEFSPSGFVAAFLVVIGVGGGTYAITGARDFTVDAGRPLPEVYSAFTGVNNVESSFRHYGFDVPPFYVARPSDHELVFTTPSANPDQSSRVALTFTPGPNGATTKVSAAIDVPPVEMEIDGKTKYLSEDKVEAKFQEAIGDMAKALSQGNSTAAATSKLRMSLDMVAIASHPESVKKLQAKAQRLNSRVNEIRRDFREQEARARPTRAPGFANSFDDEDFRYGDPTSGEAAQRRRFTRELTERIRAGRFSSERDAQEWDR